MVNSNLHFGVDMSRTKQEVVPFLKQSSLQGAICTNRATMRAKRQFAQSRRSLKPFTKVPNSIRHWQDAFCQYGLILCWTKVPWNYCGRAQDERRLTSLSGSKSHSVFSHKRLSSLGSIMQMTQNSFPRTASAQPEYFWPTQGIVLGGKGLQYFPCALSIVTRLLRHHKEVVTHCTSSPSHS